MKRLLELLICGLVFVRIGLEPPERLDAYKVLLDELMALMKEHQGEVKSRIAEKLS